MLIEWVPHAGWNIAVTSQHPVSTRVQQTEVQAAVLSPSFVTLHVQSHPLLATNFGLPVAFSRRISHGFLSCVVRDGGLVGDAPEVHVQRNGCVVVFFCRQDARPAALRSLSGQEVRLCRIEEDAWEVGCQDGRAALRYIIVHGDGGIRFAQAVHLTNVTATVDRLSVVNTDAWVVQ